MKNKIWKFIGKYSGIIGSIVTLLIIWLAISFIAWNFTWFLDSWFGRLVGVFLVFITIKVNLE